MSTRPRYTGLRRKLVLGIDVGTTFSGVSYCILDPGVTPIIQGVNRYPTQERVGGDAKIPSVIYYDSQGAVRAVGAEAMLESNVELAMEQHWIKAEWFKLYLRPIHNETHTDDDLPPLPLNKTVEQVFGDFLQYLYQCTRQYIQETHTGGVELWNSLQDHAEFVLTHPNGWDGAQQARMRSAALYAGLVPNTPAGRARIRFVTEGEASLHYCIGNNYASDVIKSGEGVIIVDAGGGTIDLSAFYMRCAPNAFEEIAPAKCLFHGSIYVTRRARAFLSEKLKKSHYNTTVDIEHITECFDKSTKLAFKDSTQTSFVKFGSSRDTDASVDIKFGQLKLQGSDVATFFEPSIVAIKQAIKEQRDAAIVPITSVLLVGGFAASNWLFSSLQTHLHSEGLSFYRPDGHLGKAVADGAVSFFIDHYVTTRVARTTFGSDLSVRFNGSSLEHQRRLSTMYVDVDGCKCVPKRFDMIIAKGTSVSETKVFRRSFALYASRKSKLSTITDKILAYRGDDSDPEWTDIQPDMFFEVCRVTANVESAVQALPCLTGHNGEQYFRFEYDIELLFGLTELEARICWKEKGLEKRYSLQIHWFSSVLTNFLNYAEVLLRLCMTMMESGRPIHDGECVAV